MSEPLHPSPSGASRHLPINGEEAPSHKRGGQVPAHARCVVIGCGIVGNSLAYHLTRLGWRDVVLLDKGPLPNPGGSTGHASNFIYLVDHSKEMTALTMDSVRQYQELGVFIRSGGIEVARTKDTSDGTEQLVLPRRRIFGNVHEYGRGEIGGGRPLALPAED